MNIVALRKNIEIKGSKPSIATLKEAIAMAVSEMNHHAAKGSLTSFELTRDRLNKQVDSYIKMRTLIVVKE